MPYVLMLYIVLVGGATLFAGASGFTSLWVASALSLVALAVLVAARSLLRRSLSPRDSRRDRRQFRANPGDPIADAPTA